MNSDLCGNAAPIQTQGEKDKPFEMKVRLYVVMNVAGLTRADLQRRLGWQRESIDRLFRLHHGSKIDQLEAAFVALGQDVEVRLSRH